MTHSPAATLRRLWHSALHHTRKNSHLAYYVRGFLAYACPRRLARRRLAPLLGAYARLPQAEQEYVRSRVDYYCKFADHIFLPADAPRLDAFTYKGRESYVHDYVNSTYFFDAYRHTRHFPGHLRWAYNPGDVDYLFPLPEITKSRPLCAGNGNNILLPLDTVRHFTWVQDPFTWEQKSGRVLFRGDVGGKPRRVRFLEMWREHPLCNLREGGGMTIYEHLSYRYIMALEGNDVASNLKWVMSSNSVAVMPRPTCETWYMEGQLVPGYHYVEIAADYHDLMERIDHYERHPEEAKAIVEHAHEWVRQFQNRRRERLISLMVLDKYFTLTGQKDY